jgi:gluconate 2-dehydrogenase gamma chain
MGALSAGMGGAWVATQWPAIAAAAEEASRASALSESARLRVLTPDEKTEIDAMSARILPSDDGPGAREAGVVYFIDRALGTFAREMRPAVSSGVSALGVTVKAHHPEAANFSSLPAADQDAILHLMDETDFFRFIRWGTIAGFLANPSYGGNRGGAGWRWMGFEDRFVWREPFGYYDREGADGP